MAAIADPAWPICQACGEELRPEGDTHRRHGNKQLACESFACELVLVWISLRRFINVMDRRDEIEWLAEQARAGINHLPRGEARTIANAAVNSLRLHALGEE